MNRCGGGMLMLMLGVIEPHGAKAGPWKDWPLLAMGGWLLYVGICIVAAVEEVGAAIG